MNRVGNRRTPWIIDRATGFGARQDLSGEDADESGMFKPAQPMTNAERQRKFRARHPGYRNRFRHVYRAPVEDVAADPAVPASPATAPVDPTAMLAAALRLAQTNAASTDRLPADADTHVALASA